MLTLLTDHVAHQARLDVLHDGAPVRVALLQRVKRLGEQKGADHPDTVRAQREIDGPDAPVALGYLLQWSSELYGRSGVGVDGFTPLTYTTIADWARLTDRAPGPHEVEALLRLDAIRRHPPLEEPLNG